MKSLSKIGHTAICWAEDMGLIVIAIATLVAFGMEVSQMFASRIVALGDLLMLFLYLEVLAMVSIYLDHGKLPVRMPLYIAIVALARYMILDMKSMDTMRVLGIAGAVLLIALGILLLRYGHNKYPYEENGNG